MTLTRIDLLSLLLCAWPLSLSAQPTVSPDRTVTFRLDALKAENVRIEGGIIKELHYQSGRNIPDAIPLTRSADGIWSVTLGPFEPSPYLYNFQIDGRSVLDPLNLRVLTGQKYRKSILLVPTQDSSAFWETRRVDYGTVHRHTYHSPIAKDCRELYVYTPPGYECQNTKYPVLYLLHGRGEKADSWLVAGCANTIADNLIAEGRAIPMLIVMPFGRAIPPNTPDQLVPGRLVTHLEEEVLTSIIPLIEKTYRVYSDRDHRAIAGFSLGGAQAAAIGLAHLDKFCSVGVFSAGLPDFERNHQDLLQEPAQTNQRLNYFFLGAGSEDDFGPGGSAIAGQRALSALLTKRGIKHSFYEMPNAGHTWYAWRYFLNYKLLPCLWSKHTDIKHSAL